jgi:hypothetical protein
MRYLIAVAAGAALLAACEAPGSETAALCTELAGSEPQMQRLFTQTGTEAKAACGCYGKMVAALPAEQRTAISQGLADMVAEKNARGLDMEGVYGLYRDGEISLAEKPYTVDDLGEAAEMIENAAEALGEDGACPV